MREKSALEPGILLKGDKVMLRPPEPAELAYIRWLWSDPETMAPVGGPVELDKERAVSWYARWVNPGRSTAGYCLVFSREEDPVGEVSFQNYDPETRGAELNLKIAAPERGKGYGKEALQLFLDWYFNVFEGESLVDDVGLDNVGGRIALERFGFQHDPAVTDTVRLRMTRERFCGR